MAVPKSRISKSKKGKRRTHQKIAAPAITTCPQCGEAKLPHHICGECGVYKGRTVIEKSE
ncbi:MAG: 50S ribosomal protein L32 [Desulfobacteraceae bacterium]|nr:MAG: 50S ribosomal protein L32 [Desulfobacteraceae bacterium]